MKLPASLARIHRSIRGSTTLVVFTVMTRLLLGAGFLPSGMTKVLGNRFTILGTDTPVGYFFEAFYQTGGWYRTVGWAQVIAAILLLVPATAHLGAFLFLPIIVNIWVITVAVGFQGTWVITTLMLLANLWLVAWEYDRLVPLLRPAVMRATRATPRALPLAVLFGVLGAAGYALLILGKVARLDRQVGWIGIVPLTIVGALFGATVALLARRVPEPTAS